MFVYNTTKDEVRVLFDGVVQPGEFFTFELPWRKAELLRAKVVAQAPATTLLSSLSRDDTLGTIHEEFRACSDECVPNVVDQQPCPPVLIFAVAEEECPEGGRLRFFPGVDLGPAQVNAEFFFRKGWPSRG